MGLLKTFAAAAVKKDPIPVGFPNRAKLRVTRTMDAKINAARFAVTSQDTLGHRKSSKLKLTMFTDGFIHILSKDRNRADFTQTNHHGQLILHLRMNELNKEQKLHKERNKNKQVKEIGKWNTGKVRNKRQFSDLSDKGRMSRHGKLSEIFRLGLTYKNGILGDVDNMRNFKKN